MMSMGMRVIKKPAHDSQKHQPNCSDSLSDLVNTCPRSSEVKLEPYVMALKINQLIMELETSFTI